jgi:hypothetical protein
VRRRFRPIAARSTSPSTETRRRGRSRAATCSPSTARRSRCRTGRC